jgi:hypothetical protein
VSLEEPEEPDWRKHITPDVVRRVSRRASMGMPLDMALEAENNPEINPDCWAEALKTNPAFAAEFAATRARFYEDALSRLLEAEDPKWLCWVLEHCHAGAFSGASDEAEETEEEQQEILGIPNDLLARAREYARNAPPADETSRGLS